MFEEKKNYGFKLLEHFLGPLYHACAPVIYFSRIDAKLYFENSELV